ncbi:hypothetical protein BDR04DRAFT_1120275 [Suillus decipiens]|nr:hypothetical protein BDR04DRAFT_1120275 [Suillus decipiens]
MSSKKSTGRPTRKIITNHFIQDQKKVATTNLSSIFLTEILALRLNEMLESRGSQEGTGEVPDIFKGDVIDWNELEKVDKGITPTGFVEEIDVVARGSQGMEPGWNINALLTSEGVAQ